MKEDYLRQVGELLTCAQKDRKRLLNRLDKGVSAYLEENPDATETQLYVAFGEPESCVAQLLDECGTSAVVARASCRRKSRMVCAVLLILAVMATLFAAYLLSTGGVIIMDTENPFGKFAADIFFRVVGKR